MKSMKIAMMALMVLLGTTANAQQEVFQKYQDCEGVTTVHVPKFLMKIAGRFDSNAKKFPSWSAGSLLSMASCSASYKRSVNDTTW